MSSSSNSLLGSFRIVGEIGRGSMGTVYLARKRGEMEMGRAVALKRLHPEHMRDLGNLRAFVREAEIGIHLNHHNVVAVQELIPDGDGYAIAMEFIDGVDLRAIFRHLHSQGRTLPLAIALEIIEQACLGLDHAHQPDLASQRPSLIHRDFKPANVMLTRSGLVKVMDFGIALLEVLGVDEDHTGGGTIKGTPRYMSPEQARGEPLTPASDIFSAGLVLYECVTGERFYRESDFLALLREAQTADIAPPLRRATGIPRPVLAVMRRALDPSPHKRFSRALAMAEELRAARRKLKEEESLTSFAARLCEALVQPVREDCAPKRGGDDVASSRPAFSTSPAASVSTLAAGTPLPNQRAAPATTGSFPSPSPRSVAATTTGSFPPSLGPLPSSPLPPGVEIPQALLDIAPPEPRAVPSPSFRALPLPPRPEAGPAPSSQSVSLPTEVPPLIASKPTGQRLLPLILVSLLTLGAAVLAWTVVLMPDSKASPVVLYVDPQSATLLVRGKAVPRGAHYSITPPEPGETLEVVISAEGFSLRTEVLTPADAGKKRFISLTPLGEPSAPPSSAQSGSSPP